MGLESTEGTAEAGVAADAILARDIEVETGPTMNAREYQGTPGQRQPVPGAQEGATLSFVTELKGDGSTSIWELDEVIQGCMGEVVVANLDSTISGTAGSTTVLDVADAANASTGSLLMLEKSTADTYEVVGIITTVNTGATPDDVTVSPGAVNGVHNTNGKKVKEMRTFSPKLTPSAVNSLTADLYYSAQGGGADQFDRITGCRGTWSMSSPRAGAIPQWSFQFTGWSVTRSTGGTRPTPVYESTSPKSAVASAFRVDGTYTNAFDINFSLNAEVAMKMSQNSTTGVYGTPHVSFKPSGSFKIHPAHSSIAHFTDWEAGTAHSLIFQVGNTVGNTWAIYVPKAVWTKVTRPDDGGVQALEIQWEAADQDDALATACDASIYLGTA